MVAGAVRVFRKEPWTAKGRIACGLAARAHIIGLVGWAKCGDIDDVHQ